MATSGNIVQRHFQRRKAQTHHHEHGGRTQAGPRKDPGRTQAGTRFSFLNLRPVWGESMLGICPRVWERLFTKIYIHGIVMATLDDVFTLNVKINMPNSLKAECS